jgi:hypothetical protein
MDTANREAADCDERRKDGAFKTYVEAALCANDALRRGLSDIHYPYMDLANSLAATRRRVAEQIDEREITEAEGDVRIADKISALISEESRRNAGSTSNSSLNNSQIATGSVASYSSSYSYSYWSFSYWRVKH